jgi:hypothetical protein
LNESTNQTYAKGGISKSAAINDSFNKTRDSFGILLSYKGINFDAKLWEITQGASQWWNVNVTLTMSSQYSSVNETVKYHVWL